MLIEEETGTARADALAAADGGVRRGAPGRARSPIYNKPPGPTSGREGMSRPGKIARLPHEVRTELNRRMNNNEPGETLLGWLNGQAAVRTVLNEQFEGAEISKQNLSDWRAGGFATWQARQELLAEAGELAADAGELTGALNQRLGDALGTVVAARYASLLRHWNGEVTDEFQKDLRALRCLCRDVTQLRRGEHSAAKLDIQEGWLEEKREKTEAEVVAQFEAWAKNTEVHDWLVKTWVNPEERERRKREMLGLPPQRSRRGAEIQCSNFSRRKSLWRKNQDQRQTKPRVRLSQGMSRYVQVFFKKSAL